jgi:peptidyl-prolyl cis-trans isomerase B (cyclophilin B)
VTSLKDRQRAQARAKLEREMAGRQEHAQRRQKQRRTAGLAALAVVVVVVLVAVVVHVAKPSKAPAILADPTNKPATCAWTPNPAPAASASPGATPSPTEPPDPHLIKTGTPPATDLPHNGTRDMVLNTSQGKITISMDLAKAPCAAESFTYLAGKNYFNGSSCHRLVTDGIYVLQCGDPTGTGEGGPSYTFASENLPTDQQPNYPMGIVAMANPGNPDLNGSQFFIVTQDTPENVDPSTNQETSNLPSQYTVVGTVTGGLDVVTKIAKAGTKDGSTDGAPKLPVKLTTVTVGAPQN